MDGLDVISIPWNTKKVSCAGPLRAGFLGRWSFKTRFRLEGPSAASVPTCFNALGFIVIWMFAVETKQLTLEEMDESANPCETAKLANREARKRALQDGDAQHA
ncbi:hypothetical protein DACRYDRAFT_103449 [Dacryopinax primogenitus]|uniref:Uncharacterized protein n=1 Tax=Dacryopinax primogenitus (strain DJM 731) TaxID=1858805 RepID=M5GH26_DACPD|nr:uncharacterized protein DACRYDRAFT_103449 [Dacryopinax primogenitus]EJU06503.1 hypothetical protein DACRYDRAFT_103449 [Dacryopinax primogenitus]